MELVTPFIGENSIKVIKWTNQELEANRDFVQRCEGKKQCFQGRLYMARASGKLFVETIFDLLTVPVFTIASPIRAVFSLIKKDKIQEYVKKTELVSPKNVALLALRVLAVAIGVLVTFFVGVFVSANLAVKTQEQLRILRTKEPVRIDQPMVAVSN